MASNAKFRVVRDEYGRRIFPEGTFSSDVPYFVRGIPDSQGHCRTNTALLSVLAHGGDVPVSVDDRSKYFDPGHSLVGVSHRELEQSAASLPLHRLGVRPEQLFSADSARTRSFIHGTISNIEEEKARSKAESSSGSSGTGSDS